MLSTVSPVAKNRRGKPVYSMQKQMLINLYKNKVVENEAQGLVIDVNIYQTGKGNGEFVRTYLVRISNTVWRHQFEFYFTSNYPPLLFSLKLNGLEKEVESNNGNKRRRPASSWLESEFTSFRHY